MIDKVPEEKDESFEIISEKEKLWRDALVEAETNYLKSEASMLQNETISTTILYSRKRQSSLQNRSYN